MSAPVIGASAPTDTGGALAATERMQHLQALIAQVESGPAGFAAALDAAQATPSATGSASAGGAAQSGASYTAGAPTASTADYPATTSATSLGLYSPSAASAGAYAGSGSPSGDAYAPLIEQAAARNGVDPSVLYGLIEQESDFNPGATSGAGALGLTQLMPGTAASLGVTEPLNPAQSIEGGARYLGQMLRQFGGNTADALAAYNAGPGAVQQYGGVPPYSETQQYVGKVLANAAAYRASTGADELPNAGPTSALVATAQTATPALTGATAATAETIA